jgi:ABC-type molybdate transport system substrate-binding protein
MCLHAGPPPAQWLDFVASDAAFKILERYGFKQFAKSQ